MSVVPHDLASGPTTTVHNMSSNGDYSDDDYYDEDEDMLEDGDGKQPAFNLLGPAD